MSTRLDALRAPMTTEHCQSPHDERDHGHYGHAMYHVHGWDDIDKEWCAIATGPVLVDSPEQPAAQKEGDDGL